MASVNDDPFGVFGDSSDDEDVEGNALVREETEVNRIGRSLVNLANRKACTVDEVPTTMTTASAAANLPADTAHECDELVLPWSPPLYIGPMKIVASLPYGGGRGCVAARKLPSGTLILVEEPLVGWSVEENRLDLETILNLFERENASQIIHDLEHFHPTKRAVDGIEPCNEDQVDTMIKSLRSQYSDDPLLPLVIEYSKERNLVNADGSAITEVDVARLLVALRYNGLESGIFMHAAMLNHADQPNCVKFLPATKEYNHQSNSSYAYSEVRTTRAVSQGEPLTISYVPRTVSHASRRKHLWEQHRFDIGADLSGSIRQMELIGNRLPVSALNKWDDDSTTHRIEMAIAELDAMYKDAVAEGDVAATSEQAKALEQTSLELCTAAEYQLRNQNHVLLVPCRRLHMDSCDLVQRDQSLSLADRLKLLGRLIVTARSLLQLQKLLLGSDHFDIARTDLDLAQAIEELLSRSPKLLLALQLEGLQNESAWSALEYKVRKDYERIKALYPCDADKYISGAKKQT